MCLIVVIIFCTVGLKSQESGWIVKDNIKTQKLQAKNIIDVCINANENLLYTLHYYYKNNINNSSIYRWKYDTGEFIDSISFQKLIPIQFSSDGLSATFVDGTFYLTEVFATNISIYNLTENNFHKKYLFKTPNDLNCRNIDKSLMYHNDVIFRNLDYNTKNDLLHLAINFGAYTYSGGGVSGTTTRYELGGNGVFEIINDTLKLLKQYTDYKNFDHLIIKDRVYLTLSKTSNQNSSTGSAYYTTINNYYYLSYLDLNNNYKAAVMQKYYEYKESKLGTGSSKSEIGKNIPLGVIGFNKEMNNVLVTYENKIFYINYDDNSLIDSFALGSMYNLTKFCNNGKYVVRIQNDSLLLANITTKSIEEIIILPFTPNKMKLISNESKLLILSTDGYFAEIEIPKCYNIIEISIDKTINEKIEIKNLNNEQIEIKFNYEFVGNSYEKIEIYDLLGNLILSKVTDKSINTNLIAIQSLHPGLYFVKVGNIIEKFVKF